MYQDTKNYIKKYNKKLIGILFFALLGMIGVGLGISYLPSAQPERLSFCTFRISGVSTNGASVDGELFDKAFSGNWVNPTLDNCVFGQIEKQNGLDIVFNKYKDDFVKLEKMDQNDPNYSLNYVTAATELNKKLSADNVQDKLDKAEKESALLYDTTYKNVAERDLGLLVFVLLVLFGLRKISGLKNYKWIINSLIFGVMFTFIFSVLSFVITYYIAYILSLA